MAFDREMSREKKEEAAAQGKPTADFINITVFGKTAENCANYLAKGSQCAIHGRINTGSYTTQTGEKRYTTDVIADRVEFLSKKETTGMPDEDTFEPTDYNPFEDDSESDVPF